MNYYFLNLDKDYSDAPKTVNWYGKIDIESILNGKYEALEKAYALEIKENSELYKTDVIFDPIFAVSEMVKFCLETYEPNMEYTRLYLVQRKEERVLEYFIPHLKEEKCLNKDMVSREKLFSNFPSIKLDNVRKDRFLFRVTDGVKTYVIAKEGFIESILRRGAKGIQINRIKVSD